MTHEIELTGLDGSNPLAFLAALGTVRTASTIWGSSAIKLGWRNDGGLQRPVLSSEVTLTRREFTDHIDRELEKMSGHAAFTFADNLSVAPEEFANELRDASAAASVRDRIHADFLAAFGSEVVSVKQGQKTVIADTALRTMSGAGHQHFLGFMRKLVDGTNAEHLEKALFETWRYDDGKPSMRWYPADDRRRAFRHIAPTDDPLRTVRGANRLAIGP